MARKNIFDDINDFLNTDASPGPTGESSTRRYGDYDYRTYLPFGDRGKTTPKKVVAPKDSKKEIAEKKARVNIGRKRKK